MQDKVKLMVYLYGNGDLNIQRVSFPIDLFNPSISYDEMSKYIPWTSATSVYILGMSILRVWRVIEELQ